MVCIRTLYCRRQAFCAMSFGCVISNSRMHYNISASITEDVLTFDTTDWPVLCARAFWPSPLGWTLFWTFHVLTILPLSDNRGSSPSESNMRGQSFSPPLSRNFASDFLFYSCALFVVCSDHLSSLSSLRVSMNCHHHDIFNHVIFYLVLFFIHIGSYKSVADSISHS